MRLTVAAIAAAIGRFELTIKDPGIVRIVGFQRSRALVVTQGEPDFEEGGERDRRADRRDPRVRDPQTEERRTVVTEQQVHDAMVRLYSGKEPSDIGAHLLVNSIEDRRGEVHRPVFDWARTRETLFAAMRKP